MSPRDPLDEARGCVLALVVILLAIGVVVVGLMATAWLAAR